MRYECAERIQAIIRDAIKQFFFEEQQFQVKLCLDAFIGITIDEMGMFYVTLKEVFDKEKMAKESGNGAITRKSGNVSVNNNKKRRLENALSEDMSSSHSEGTAINDGMNDSIPPTSETSCDDAMEDQRIETVHHSLPLSWLKRNIESAPDQGESSFNCTGGKPETADSYQDAGSFSAASYGEEDNEELTGNSTDEQSSGTVHFWFDTFSKPLEDLKKRPPIMTDQNGHCIHGECIGRKIKVLRSNFRRHWLEIHSPIVEARQCPVPKCNKWMLRDYNAHFINIHGVAPVEAKNMSITDFKMRWFTRQAWDTVRSYRRHNRSGSNKHPYVEITDEQLMVQLTSQS